MSTVVARTPSYHTQLQPFDQPSTSRLHKIIFYPLNLINYFKTSCSKGAMWELAPFFF
jgi:hypothetical protein